MVHKLESVHVELLDLTGAQTTDEAVQCHHLCSSQLLRCQAVMFSNGLPHRLYLLRRIILISKHHEYNSHLHIELFLTCDSFQLQRAISSRVSSEKASVSRSESEKP